MENIIRHQLRELQDFVELQELRENRNLGELQYVEHQITNKILMEGYKDYIYYHKERYHKQRFLSELLQKEEQLHYNNLNSMDYIQLICLNYIKLRNFGDLQDNCTIAKLIDSCELLEFKFKNKPKIAPRHVIMIENDYIYEHRVMVKPSVIKELMKYINGSHKCDTCKPPPIYEKIIDPSIDNALQLGIID